MDPTLKAKWTAALRSGEYLQGRALLRTYDGRYCCLGVLCVVAGFKISDSGYGVASEDEHDLGYTPLKVVTALEDLKPLYTMNDNGTSFADIADYIDANL